MANTKIPVELSSTPGIVDNSNATAITIDSSENVGIGTASPNVHGWTKALSIDGGASNSSAVELNQNGTKVGALSLQGDQRVQVVNYTANPITFHTNGIANERMRITSGGNVGINLTDPQTYGGFTVKQQSNTSSEGIAVLDSTSAQSVKLWVDGTNSYLSSGNTGADPLILNAGGGNVGIGTTSPQAELHVSNGSAGFEFKPDGISDGTSYMQVYDRVANSYDNLRYYAAEHYFHIGNNEKMRIDSGGRVMIAETSNSGYSANADDLIVGDNGSATERGISIGATSGGSIRWNDGADAGIIEYAHSSNSMRLYTAGSERMRITSDGEVRINAIARQTMAEFNNRQNGAVIEFGHENNGGQYYGTLGVFGTNGHPYIGFSTDCESSADTFTTRGVAGNIITGDIGNGSLKFMQVTSASATGQTPVERMRITSTGNLCVGTTAATTSTGVAGTFRSDAASDPSIDLAKISGNTTSANIFIRFHASSGGTAMGGIAGNGGGNAQFIAISDERLKENINPLSGSLNKVLALNPVSYDWKKSGEHIEAGFVAQEVEEILPEYVTTEENEEQTKGLTGGMTAGYIAVLTKAIQEQQAQIEALQSEINLLKGE